MANQDPAAGDPSDIRDAASDNSLPPEHPRDIFARIAIAAHRLLDPICRNLCYVSAIVTLVMATCMVVDLVSRLVFRIPLTGMIELQTFMLVFVAFSSVAYTMLKNQHVAVDLITSKLSDQTNSFLQSIFSVWGAFIFGVMGVFSAARAVDAFAENEIADITRIPFWLIYSAVALGTVLLSLALLAALFTHLSGLYRHYGVRSRFWFVLAAVVIISIAGIFSADLMKALFGNITPAVVGGIYTLLMMVILLLGFPVAFSMAFTGLTGLMFLTSTDVAFNVAKTNTYDAVAQYFFLVIPFFLLMGFLVLHAGIGSKLYNAGIKIFGRLPGGLAIGTVAGCGGFAAICGESVASAATMGSGQICSDRAPGSDGSLLGLQSSSALVQGVLAVPGQLG